MRLYVDNFTVSRVRLSLTLKINVLSFGVRLSLTPNSKKKSDWRAALLISKFLGVTLLECLIRIATSTLCLFCMVLQELCSAFHFLIHIS